MSGLSSLWPIALIGFLLAAVPWISVVGLVVALALHFWIGSSLLWMLVPAALFGVWGMFLLFIARHD